MYRIFTGEWWALRGSQQGMRGSLETTGDPARLGSSRNAKETSCPPCQFICPSPGGGKSSWGTPAADSSKHACLSPGALAALLHQLGQPSNFSVLILKISKAIFPQIGTWQKSAFPRSRALFARMNFFPLLICYTQTFISQMCSKHLLCTQ